MLGWLFVVCWLWPGVSAVSLGFVVVFVFVFLCR